MRKRIILLALGTILIFSGCNNKTSTKDDKDNKEEVSTEAPTEKPTEEATVKPTPEPTKDPRDELSDTVIELFEENGKEFYEAISDLPNNREDAMASENVDAAIIFETPEENKEKFTAITGEVKYISPIINGLQYMYVSYAYSRDNIVSIIFKGDTTDIKLGDEVVAYGAYIDMADMSPKTLNYGERPIITSNLLRKIDLTEFYTYSNDALPFNASIRDKTTGTLLGVAKITDLTYDVVRDGKCGYKTTLDIWFDADNITWEDYITPIIECGLYDEDGFKMGNGEADLRETMPTFWGYNVTLTTSNVKPGTYSIVFEN